MLFEMIFALFTPERMVGDHEFCWRAQFLLAAVLFREYDTTSGHPPGKEGFSLTATTSRTCLRGSYPRIFCES